MTEILECLKDIYENSEPKISSRNFGDLTRTELDDYLSNSSISNPILYHDVRIELEKGVMQTLVSAMRTFLVDFIETNSDRIGISCPISHQINPELKDFTLNIVQAIFLLGPQKTAKYLEDWKSGKPLKYQWKVHITGIHVEDSIQTPSGMQIASPINPETEVISSVYGYNFRSRSGIKEPYGAILTFDIICNSVFFKLNSTNLDEYRNIYKLEYDNIDINNYYEYSKLLCIALALHSKNEVNQMCTWYDHGDLSAFSGTISGINSYSDERLPRITTPLTQQNFDLSIKKLPDIVDAMKIIPGYEIAISRWIKSFKNEMDLADSYIDLRIASEAILLGKEDKTGEKSFRLAVRAAWLFGNNFTERMEIYNLFKKFYDEASKFIHVSKSKPKSDDLMEDSKKWSRLKIVQRKIQSFLLEPKKIEQDDWLTMILGKSE